jgi:hypothetical protein
MPWRRLALLILTALLYAGCAVEFAGAFVQGPDLPVNVYAQDSWSDEQPVGMAEHVLSERQAIVDCLQQWNEATAPYRKAGAPKPFEFQGFIPVPDFESKSSLRDHRSVIYRIPELTPEIREMIADSGYLNTYRTLLGYGLPDSDVLIFTGTFLGHVGSDASYQAILTDQVICHELGHVLGVQHHHEDGIMNVNIPWSAWGDSRRYVSDVDAKAFRLVHPDDYR